jgi:hypothetical protein
MVKVGVAVPTFPIAGRTFDKEIVCPAMGEQSMMVSSTMF